MKMQKFRRFLPKYLLFSKKIRKKLHMLNFFRNFAAVFRETKNARCCKDFYRNVT